ncbi:HIT family protein [Ramlibacter sp. MMS24-I3-19]|uniref:HIT family protein n=1 Tax=Ramlibacter sp. MMS24-I3-19 TaxID=3416606 RepID=UPI003D01E930
MKAVNLQPPCVFCELPTSRVEVENQLAIGFSDAFPVTAGHRLVIPRRHVQDYWSLTAEEREACHELLVSLRQAILASDPTVSGFNVGVNAGAAAGQTVFHCHFHLVPRRVGDVTDPRGGIRHVIPGKGRY